MLQCVAAAIFGAEAALVSLIHFFSLQYTATHCNTLHHTATHCNTLQHNMKQVASAPTPNATFGAEAACFWLILLMHERVRD